MRKVHVLLLTLAIMMGFNANLCAQATAGSLPVVLVSFSANLAGSKKIAISWTTRQQISTDFFNVEKSNDAINWQRIATVNATGNSTMPVTYNVFDMFPVKGSNFYRICFKNTNGESGYTITKNVRMHASGSINIYPNPSANMVNILLGEVPATDWNLFLINSMGKVIVQKKYKRNITTVNLPIDKYPNGSYNLEIAYGNYRQSNELVINHN